MRPMYFHFDQSEQMIYACTNRGTIVKLNFNLEIISSSAPIYNINSLNVITGDANWIYAREITGKLIRWNKETLQLDRIIDLAYWTPSEHANFPNVSHGLQLYADHVYVSMPSGRIGKFRCSDLEFVSETKSASHSLMEYVETTQLEHFAVDFSGWLYRGHIDHELKPVARIAHGACHQVIYDRRHERYWITDDFHCGLALFRADNPKKFMRLSLTNDDVEGISFNQDQSELLVPCFDRYIYRISNEEKPKVIHRYGPLAYQVTQAQWIDSHFALALTEAGDLYKINLSDGTLHRSTTGTNAVWDIKASGTDTYWVAFEDGTIREVEVKKSGIRTLREKDLQRGMVRRLLTDSDGGVFALTASGSVVKLDSKLEVVWSHSTAPLLRDMALKNRDLLFCGETGELTLLNADTGKPKWTKNFNEPLWAVTIDPKGRQFMVAHRANDRGDQGCESSGRGGCLWIGDLENGVVTTKNHYGGNIKRLTWIDDDKFLMNGNGPVATSLVNFKNLETIRQWSAWQLNTAEATAILNDRLFTTTYGYQLNTFDLKGEIIESAFPFEDYATSLTPTSCGGLLAGGRGAFLSLFNMKEDRAYLVQSVHFS